MAYQTSINDIIDKHIENSQNNLSDRGLNGDVLKIEYVIILLCTEKIIRRLIDKRDRHYKINLIAC